MDYPEANTRFDQDAGLNIPDQNAYFSYWGDANWDVRQRFTFSEVYNIPGLSNGVGAILTKGWSVSGLGVVQSGTPYWVIDNRPFDPECSNGGTPVPCSSAPAGSTLITPIQMAPDSGDYNLDGTDYDVPNTPTTNFGGSHSRQAYKTGLFTVADFPQPALGTEGNLKRNTYRNPGFIEFDASVMKNTHVPKLGEAGNFQLRFDFLNLFNHVNLGPVNSDMAATNFGTVTTSLPARQLQLGARIEF